jgi:hypothetical protein
VRRRLNRKTARNVSPRTGRRRKENGGRQAAKEIRERGEIGGERQVRNAVHPRGAERGRTKRGGT